VNCNSKLASLPDRRLWPAVRSGSQEPRFNRRGSGFAGALVARWATWIGALVMGSLPTRRKPCWCLGRSRTSVHGGSRLIASPNSEHFRVIQRSACPSANLTALARQQRQLVLTPGKRFFVIAITSFGQGPS